MLASMTNPEIIEYIQRQPTATDAERELAERLLAAVEEMDILVNEVHVLEAKHQAEEGGDVG